MRLRVKLRCVFMLPILIYEFTPYLHIAPFPYIPFWLIMATSRFLPGFPDKQISLIFIEQIRLIRVKETRSSKIMRLGNMNFRSIDY